MIDWLHATQVASRDAQAWRMLGRSLAFQALSEGVRYGVAGFLVWGALHVILRRRLAHRLIGEWPRAGDVQRELAYSLGSLVVFGATGMFIFAMILAGRVEIYAGPRTHGLAWLVLSLPAMLLWQDAFFYWSHRLLHSRCLFSRVHGVHHRSRNPSPWAAYAFHPVEAFINALALPLALLVVPLHVGVVVVFGLHQILRNAHGHAAIETLPRGFVRHRFWGCFTTTTHHHLHHETASGNYGLWFTWWDRWGGTERTDYLRRFDAATAPRGRP